MTRNVGVVDRLVRVVAAGSLVVVGAFVPAWPAVVLGILVALTTVVGFDPLYRLYGLSTIGGVHRDCGNGSCELPVSRGPVR